MLRHGESLSKLESRRAELEVTLIQSCMHSSVKISLFAVACVSFPIIFVTLIYIHSLIIGAHNLLINSHMIKNEAQKYTFLKHTNVFSLHYKSFASQCLQKNHRTSWSATSRIILIPTPVATSLASIRALRVGKRS